MSLGKRLKESRGIRKYTQEQVSNIIGIDYTTVSKHENDKSEPDNATLEKYSKLYLVNAHWLLYGEGDRELSLSQKLKMGMGVAEQTATYETTINQQILLELARRKNLDLSDPEQKQLLEKLIDLVITQHTKPK